MAESFPSSPEAPLGRGNNDDRRQWRKQGVIVGAAASKMQAKRCECWVQQPGCGAPLAGRKTLSGPQKLLL